MVQTQRDAVDDGEARGKDKLEVAARPDDVATASHAVVQLNDAQAHAEQVLGRLVVVVARTRSSLSFSRRKSYHSVRS